MKCDEMSWLPEWIIKTNVDVEYVGIASKSCNNVINNNKNTLYNRVSYVSVLRCKREVEWCFSEWYLPSNNNNIFVVTCIKKQVEESGFHVIPSKSHNRNIRMLLSFRITVNIITIITKWAKSIPKIQMEGCNQVPTSFEVAI